MFNIKDADKVKDGKPFMDKYVLVFNDIFC